MNFVMIGADASADAFVEAATAAGDRLIAYIDIPSKTRPPELAGVRRIGSMEELSGIEGVDYLVLSGLPERRAEHLQYLARLDPVDLVAAVPVANRPDVYYEFGLLREETKIRVLPLLAELGHPAVAKLRALLDESGPSAVRWLEWTQPLGRDREGLSRFLDGWIWLRVLIGEIESVNATPAGGDPPAQVIVSARAQSGLVGTMRWLDSASPAQQIHVELNHGTIDVDLPEGFNGPATIRTNRGAAGGTEEVVAADPLGVRWYGLWKQSSSDDGALWVHATRQVELADAVDRSLKRERAVSMEYDEFSDAAGFKSIMTATGCGIIWLVILLAILAAVGVPYIHYAILPVLVVFALFQLFGLIYRQPATPPVGDSKG